MIWLHGPVNMYNDAIQFSSERTAVRHGGANESLETLSDISCGLLLQLIQLYQYANRISGDAV
jgi:hypothetical protein